MVNISPYTWRMPIYAPFTDALPVPTVDPSEEDGIVQVCFNQAYLPYILGALAVYTYDDAFNLQGDAEPEAVQRFTSLLGIFAAALEGCNMFPFDVRQSEEEPCILEKFVDGDWVEFANLRLCPPIVRLNINLQVEISFDNGETFEVLTPNEQPPVPLPDPEQVARCVAAASATEAMNALFVQVKSYFNSEIAFLIAVAGVISLAAVYIFFPPAIPLVLEFFVGLWGALSEITDDEFDETTKDDLRCILFCAATEVDGVVTFDFDEVIAEIGERWEAPTLNIWTAIEYLTYIVGEQGLNNAGATGVVTEADCSDCDDCPECLDYEDLMFSELGSKTCIGTLTSNIECGDNGTYTAAMGREGGGAVVGVARTGGGRWCTVLIDLGLECEVQGVGVWSYRNDGSGTMTRVVQSFNAAGTLVDSVVTGGVGTGWVQFANTTGWGMCRYIYIFIESNIASDIRLDDVSIQMA